MVRDKDIFQQTMTFFQNLDFPCNFWGRNKIMLQFFLNIDLTPHAEFHENPIKRSVWHTSQKMSTNWVTFGFGTMTSGHTLRARMAMAKFFTLQAQAIAEFSSCGEAACYPEILRIWYNFVQGNICIGQIMKTRFWQKLWTAVQCKGACSYT